MKQLPVDNECITIPKPLLPSPPTIAYTLKSLVEIRLPYSGKLLRDFYEFQVLWLFPKVVFMKFGGVASFGDTREQSAKVFSANIYFPPICKRFILQKFPTI